jgi:hypothetical protein
MLCVFGCKCFPLLRPYTAHKLKYHSKSCIFLGYNHAGYRCLDPITNHVYFARHVVFDEQSFPAKDHAQFHLPSKVNASSDVPFPPSVSISLPAPISCPSNTHFATEHTHVQPPEPLCDTRFPTTVEHLIVPPHTASTCSSHLPHSSHLHIYCMSPLLQNLPHHHHQLNPNIPPK